MASCLRKLLRKSPPARLISTFHSTCPAPLSLIYRQTLSVETNPDHEANPNNVLPFLGFIKGENLIHSKSPFLFPSFPFGLISGPVSLPVSIQSELDEDDSGDYGTIWADSVKKKRKKKMNKHKYKKLRKRLRRKT